MLFILRISNYKTSHRYYLIHGLDPDADQLGPAPIDVSADPLLQILPDPVQLLRRGHRVVDEGLHLVLDQSVLRNRRIDAVHVTLVRRTTRRTAAQTLRHFQKLFVYLFICLFVCLWQDVV